MSRLGILLPLSCLPSHYGIGDMGDYAYTFLRILQRNHIRYWYINGLHEVRSLTYAKSYYAGNPIYISLNELVNMKLLRRSELRHFHKFSENVLYEEILHFKNTYYKMAFQRFQTWKQSKKQEYNQFCEQHWVNAYARFCVDDTYFTSRKIVSLYDNMDHKIKEKVEYVMFLQYIYDIQWRKLKQYANGLGIDIIVDVSFHKEGFDKAYAMLYQGDKKIYGYQMLCTWLCKRYDIVYCKGQINQIEYVYIQDALYVMNEEQKQIVFNENFKIFNFTKQQIIQNTARWFCTSDSMVGSLMYQYHQLANHEKVRMRRALKKLEIKDKKFSHKVITWCLKQKNTIAIIAVWDILHLRIKLQEDNVTFRLKKVSQIEEVMKLLHELQR